MQYANHHLLVILFIQLYSQMPPYLGMNNIETNNKNMRNLIKPQMKKKKTCIYFPAVFATCTNSTQNNFTQRFTY